MSETKKNSNIFLKSSCQTRISVQEKLKDVRKATRSQKFRNNSQSLLLLIFLRLCQLRHQGSHLRRGFQLPERCRQLPDRTCRRLGLLPVCCRPLPVWLRRRQNRPELKSHRNLNCPKELEQFLFGQEDKFQIIHFFLRVKDGTKKNLEPNHLK